MSGRATDIEIAQALLKEMGRESLLAYFTRRLHLGRELETRPLLLGAFARLAGPDSEQLLISIANDLSEGAKTRVAAARALGQLVNQLPQTNERAELMQVLVKLLGDTNMDVRSAVALQLSELQAEEAVVLLQKLIEEDKLDVLAREEVQKFLSTTITPSANLPRIPTTPVVARPELSSLREAFKHSQIVTLAGMGGVGKTTLAAQFASESEYEVKVWRSCRYSLDPADLANGLLAQLTEQLQLGGTAEGKDISSPHFDWGRVQNQIVDLLRDHSALIVLDDYEEANKENETQILIERLVARLSRVNFLIVSRLVPRILNGVVVRLEGLSFADSLEVLRAVADRRNFYLDPGAAQKIVQLAEGNALVLNLYISALSEGLSIDEVLRTDKEPLVSSLVNRSLEKLTDLERRTLEVLSQFDEPIPARDSKINELFNHEGITSLSEHLSHLNQLSLIFVDAHDSLTVHTLIRELISSRTDKRTLLRVNRSLASFYEERGNLIRAATHFVRARLSNQANLMIHDHLEDLINQGHLSSALEVLNSISSKDLDLNAQIQLLTSVGFFSRFRRQHERAMDSYQQALAIARKLGAAKIESSILCDIGRVYADIGAIDKAIRYFTKGLGIAREIGDRTAERIALGEIGGIHIEVGASDKAIEYYEKALTIAREIGDRKGEGIALGSLGRACADMGETDRAIAYHDQRLEIAREIGDAKSESIALGDLGRAYLLVGMSERAVQYYDQRLVIARKIGDTKSESIALGDLGRAYSRLGMTDRAVASYEQRVAIAREIGDTKGESLALRDLGRSYSRLGMTDRAVGYYEERRTIAREIGDRKGENNALGDLGRAYLRLGMTDRAVHYYEERLTITREIGDRRGESIALGDLGAAYLHLGMTDRAVAYYEERLAVAREVGDRKGESNALADLGRAYSRIGMTDRAIAFYEERLAIAREIRDPRREGTALAALARSYVDGGNSGKAIQLYEDLLRVMREMRDRRSESNVLGNLGKLYAASGESQRAVDFFNEQIAIAREIGDRRSEAAGLFNLSLEFDKLGNRDLAIKNAEDSLTIFEQTQESNAVKLREKLAQWRAEGT